uniref:Folylpolyglutamate synthase n=1 Tax=Apteryx owenii TaxID=8824 RepID=A0A8B9S937_APTOW
GLGEAAASRLVLFAAARQRRSVLLSWAWRAGLPPAAVPPSRVPDRPAPFQDAIRTLNTLQTNASYLEQVKRERGDPRAQLEAMKGFLERSGLKVEDLDRLNIIHVTGTKGKGSVCAFAERVLRSYGLKTGFYSSPHLVQVRERIRINGQPISKELFSKYFWLVYNRLEETKDPAHASMPAYFRFLTIMAFHVFLQEKVDLAVVEVGIGGAYDCTNIIRKPVVCGVSSLGIDHTSILGDTLEKIAWQKGGIFKPGVPAFTVAQPERPLEVLRDRAPPAWGAGPCAPPAAGAPRPPSPAPLPPGLREAEWLGRTQVLPHGPVTWYIDGAHTTSSVQACVRWFRQAQTVVLRSGSEVRVLLFNATGDRDTAALLKLLLPCQFDYAVFCPNFAEVSVVGNADQQNFNVTLENALTRCLENQKTWTQLMEEKVGQDLWLSAPLEVGSLLKPDPVRGALLLVPSAERPLNSNSLVFPCISHALQWIAQGRDPCVPAPAAKGAHPHPVASSGAVLLQEAAVIRVLVTGSLHLVGGVLKLLDPALSQ